MRNVNIFFFSGTGNTWWVSMEIARLLADQGIRADAHSIERLSAATAAQLIAGCDVVGFGYPTYGSDLPEPMQTFMDQLQNTKPKKCFVFCTQWIWSGDGARVGAELLASKGFEVCWGEHFLLPNNVCVTAVPLPFTNEREQIDRVLERASRRLTIFSEKIISGQVYRRGFHPLSQLLGSLQRLPFRSIKERMRNEIGVDAHRCTQCGYCVAICPVENLALCPSSFFARGHCIFCMRCYNFCPRSAITYRCRPHNLRRGVPYRGPVEAFDPLQLR